MTPDRNCSICDSETVELTVREMMFGSGDVFRYKRCVGCGFLEIVDPPEDLGRYYPVGYRSFDLPRHKEYSGPLGSLRRQFGKLKVQGATHGTLLGKAAGCISKPVNRSALDLIRSISPPKGAQILDVGSGTGKLIRQLDKLRMYQLQGVDPFISESIVHSPRCRVEKRGYYEVSGQYDLVMFHHSLEHMQSHRQVLDHAMTLLKPQGRVLIRIPILSDLIWALYRTDWVQIDAPRHLSIHTITSFCRLARDCGFEVVKIAFDSFPFQFWGSERYRHGISLTDRSRPKHHPASISRRELRTLRALSESLNRKGLGDQAGFILAPEGSA